MSLPTDLIDTETLIRWRKALTSTLDDVDDVHTELCKIINERKRMCNTDNFPTERSEVLARLLFMEAAKDWR